MPTSGRDMLLYNRTGQDPEAVKALLRRSGTPELRFRRGLLLADGATPARSTM